MKWLLILFMIVSIDATCQSANWATSLIPARQRENANVVKRYESSNLSIEDVDGATLTVHTVYTVLNDKGRRVLAFHQYTTRYITLKDVEIHVYDSTGKSTGKYKKKDLQTTAVGDGLIEDGQLVYYIVNSETYPVTVEFEYEIKLTGTLSLPTYRIFDEENESVIESSYTVKAPASIGFRFRNRNTVIEPIVEKNDNYEVYKWQARDLQAFEYEEGAASPEDCFPSVVMAMNHFSFYGHTGELSSWRSFGEWIGSLYKGLDELPTERKEFFRQMVHSASDETQKARVIYEYLQRNFRYVSIQLGIGGLRPFSATFTDEKKYGDCKALSNYMRAALTAVGIRSYLAIINAGYDNVPVDPSFPVNDFNHVIVCIPRNQDSIWLECTSSTTGFGELGNFTENRNALLITETGGQLVSTPKSLSQENILKITTRVELAEDGSGISRTAFSGTGSYREMLDYINREKRDDQKESIVTILHFKQPDDFEYTQKNPGSDSLVMTIEKVHEFKAGSKYFFSPRIYKIWTRKMPPANNRKLDYYFHFPFEVSDTTIYLLPPGYKVETLPASKNIKCEFGEYTSSFWYDENLKAVCSSIKWILKEYHIPATKYAVVRKFVEDVMNDEQQKLVVKSE